MKKRGFAIDVDADLEVAINLFREAQDNLGLAMALLILGEEEHRSNRLSAAKPLYEAAIKLYRTERNNLGIAHAMLHLGILESGLGALVDGHFDLPESIGTECRAGLERAKNLLIEARELYIGESYSLGVAMTSILLARISHLVGDLGPRDALLDQAVQAAETCNVPGILKFVRAEGRAMRSPTTSIII